VSSAALRAANRATSAGHADERSPFVRRQIKGDADTASA
jgi:hypothetical protein